MNEPSWPTYPLADLRPAGQAVGRVGQLAPVALALGDDLDLVAVDADRERAGDLLDLLPLMLRRDLGLVNDVVALVALLEERRLPEAEGLAVLDVDLERVGLDLVIGVVLLVADDELDLRLGPVVRRDREGVDAHFELLAVPDVLHVGRQIGGRDLADPLDQLLDVVRLEPEQEPALVVHLLVVFGVLAGVPGPGLGTPRLRPTSRRRP